MTKNEIMSEMLTCQWKIRELETELKKENDFSKKRDLVEKMLSIAGRISELDTLNKHRILTRLKRLFGVST